MVSSRLAGALLLSAVALGAATPAPASTAFQVFKPGPGTTAYWRFHPDGVKGQGFRNLAPEVPAGLGELAWMDTPEFKTHEGQVGVQIGGTAFGRMDWHSDLGAANSQGIISYGARIRLDTMRKDYSSMVAGFYDCHRTMVDTVGRLHLGMQNSGEMVAQRWLRTDSDPEGPRVGVKTWHEVVFTLDARDPRRVVGYLFLDGKQLDNPHFDVNYDGVRAMSDHPFQVGRVPSEEGPPWWGSSLHGVISELIVERGYIHQPTRPHPDHGASSTSLESSIRWGRPGDTVVVPVQVRTSGERALRACRFDLRLDTAVGRLIGVRRVGFTSDWTLGWSAGDSGSWTVSLAGPNRLLAGGETPILELGIEIPAGAAEGASTSAFLEKASLDEVELPAASLRAGAVKVGPEPASLRGSARREALPSARIAGGALEVPAPVAPISVVLTDLSGRSLLRRSGPAGSPLRVSLEGLPRGVLVCEVRAGGARRVSFLVR